MHQMNNERFGVICDSLIELSACVFFSHGVWNGAMTSIAAAGVLVLYTGLNAIGRSVRGYRS